MGWGVLTSETPRYTDTALLGSYVLTYTCCVVLLHTGSGVTRDKGGQNPQVPEVSAAPGPCRSGSVLKNPQTIGETKTARGMPGARQRVGVEEEGNGVRKRF